jgi:2-phosphoglycerate kinase
MAKIYVTDAAGDNPVPFLRGILTRSLNEAGLPFEQAYEVASEVRNRLGDSSKVTDDELRSLVREYLRENFSAGVVESYDAVGGPTTGVLVREPDGDLHPLSRTEHLRCLASCGLGEEQARRVSNLILDKLGADQRWEISSEELRELTEECLSAHFGSRAVERYRVWMDFSQSGRPLILLIGGTTGSGKSTVATELAHRLGIVRTQSTDLLREVMRMLIPPRLLPVLHRSSFDAWSALTAKPEGEGEQDDLLAAGFLRQAELLAVPCEAVIQRAVRERVSLILEGVHVHPTLLESIGQVSDAVIVPVMLGVIKPEELRSRLSGRLQEAPERDGIAHLSNYEHIWRLQAYLLSEADRAGIPILVNEDKDKVADLVLTTVIDMLASEGSWRRGKGGGDS